MSTPAESMKLIPGTPLPLGKKVYVCPALNIKMMKAFKTDLDLIQQGMKAAKSETDEGKMEEYLTSLVKVTATALSRNYPDITEDMVEEGIDLNNIKEVALAVLGASGFRTTDQMKAEEAVYGAPGESTGTA